MIDNIKEPYVYNIRLYSVITDVNGKELRSEVVIVYVQPLNIGKNF